MSKKEEASAEDLLTCLRITQTFPTRTEGSVKKHWYKVSMPQGI